MAERLGVKTPGVPATPEALNSRYLEEREKWPKVSTAIRRTTLPAAQYALCVPSLCCTTGTSTDSGDEVSLWHLHCVQDPTSLHDHRDVHTVDELRHLHNSDINHLVEELFFNLLVKLLNLGLFTILNFFLFLFSSFSPNRSLPSSSISPRTTPIWKPMNSESFITRSVKRRFSKNSDWSSFVENDLRASLDLSVYHLPHSLLLQFLYVQPDGEAQRVPSPDP